MKNLTGREKHYSYSFLSSVSKKESKEVRAGIILPLDSEELQRAIIKNKEIPEEVSQLEMFGILQALSYDLRHY